MVYTLKLHWNMQISVTYRVCQKNKILENCKCTLISWTHGPNKVKNSKGVYHFDVNLARAFAFKFTKGKVKFIKGKCEIFVFCPFCLKISINFYFESHESNVPIDTVLLIPILLYILTFHVMSWMSQNVTKWPKMPFCDIHDVSASFQQSAIKVQGRILQVQEFLFNN